MSQEKHHWDKKHKPLIKQADEDQFNEALERADKNPANKVDHTVNPGYMMRGGIPHKFKNGIWTPLTKM